MGLGSSTRLDYGVYIPSYNVKYERKISHIIYCVKSIQFSFRVVSPVAVEHLKRLLLKLKSTYAVPTGMKYLYTPLLGLAEVPVTCSFQQPVDVEVLHENGGYSKTVFEVLPSNALKIGSPSVLLSVNLKMGVKTPFSIRFCLSIASELRTEAIVFFACLLYTSPSPRD